MRKSQRRTELVFDQDLIVRVDYADGQVFAADRYELEVGQLDVCVEDQAIGRIADQAVVVVINDILPVAQPEDIGVVAAAAFEDVIAGATIEIVAGGKAGEFVVSGRADQKLGLDIFPRPDRFILVRKPELFDAPVTENSRSGLRSSGCRSCQ